MTIIETIVRLRNDLKLWVANNLRVKADIEYVEEVTSEIQTKLDAKGNCAFIILSNTTIVVSQWESDAASDEYPYSAKIPCENVTSDFVPSVTFNIDDANSGNFAPVAQTTSGFIYVYANEIPTVDITIPTIELQATTGMIDVDNVVGGGSVGGVDTSLTQEGMAADAAVVGRKFKEVDDTITEITNELMTTWLSDFENRISALEQDAEGIANRILPVVTVADAGKMARVNENGEWELILVEMAEEGEF